MTCQLLLSTAIFALAGCGGSTTPEPDVAPDTGGGDPFATTGANGTYGNRDEACARISAALTTRASAVGCAVTNAACPGIVDDLEQRAGVRGRCPEYDLGSLANCEARIASYATCADFGAKSCQIVLRPATNCATADAGSDAPSEGG